MSLEIQVERMRVTEALIARDNVVHRLTAAYASIRQKTATIEQLQQEREILRLNNLHLSPNDLTKSTDDKSSDEEIHRLEGTIKKLQDEIRLLKNESPKFVGDPPPRYEEGKTTVSKVKSKCTFI
jgi:hypothetical protein